MQNGKHEHAINELRLDGLFTSLVLARLVAEFAKTKSAPQDWLKGFIADLQKDSREFLPALRGPWELEHLSKEVDALDGMVQEILWPSQG